MPPGLCNSSTDMQGASEENEAVDLSQQRSELFGQLLEQLVIIDRRTLPGYTVEFEFHYLCSMLRGNKVPDKIPFDGSLPQLEQAQRGQGLPPETDGASIVVKGQQTP